MLYSGNETAFTYSLETWETFKTPAFKSDYTSYKLYVLVPLMSSPWSPVLCLAINWRKQYCTYPALRTSESWETQHVSHWQTVWWYTNILSIFFLLEWESFCEISSEKKFILIFKPYELDLANRLFFFFKHLLLLNFFKRGPKGGHNLKTSLVNDSLAQILPSLAGKWN